MKKVRVLRYEKVMDHYSQDPFNPHPPFPQWSRSSIYPYQFWGSMRKYVKKRKYQMVQLDNDFIRLIIAPDIGGRIWDIYDKIGRRHLANFNKSVHSNNSGFGLNYTTGGIECNYPMAHSCTTNQPREVSVRRYDDGSAAVIISELDRIWRTRWSVAYVLYPDRSVVMLRVRTYNRTPFDSWHMYWDNCGFVLNESSQFIFPEDTASMHGLAEKTFSWPLWRHRDLSFWRNVPPEMLGLYMLDAKESYFGYYDHKGAFGLVHYADLADLPGKKYWTWGTRPSVLKVLRRCHHASHEVYGEVQAGRIVVQEHRDKVPPETECEWRHIWYPVRGTGAFNGAGPGAAMRVEVVKATDDLSRIKITAMGNGSFPDARVVVTSDGAVPVEQLMPLTPNGPVERLLTLKGDASPERHTAIVLRTRSGELLASSRLRHPSKQDCWREVVEVAERVEPTGVEQVFRVAEEKARDWGNHDLQPLYESALKQDSSFSPARRELGKLALWQGLYDDAIRHLQTARQRDPDSLEIRYFLGLALMYRGRLEEARQMFELSARYDWEARSLARLAELRMRERDWHHALSHLDRLAEAYPRLTRPRGLRAVCLRKLRLQNDAAREIAAALRLDGQDPFLQMEAMFARSGNASRGLPGPTKALLDQVRKQEPPLLEAAFDYLRADLYEEAHTVLRVIPGAGPLALFVRAYVSEQLGRRKEATKCLRRACRSDVVGHHPWQLEMIAILEWAHNRSPNAARPVFLLGNLLMARRRMKEGFHLWEKAEKMGERHYLLFANLGFYQSRMAKNRERATYYFGKASKTEPADLYVKREFFSALYSTRGVDGAIRFLEKERNAVLTSPPLAYELLNAYLTKGEYEKFDALCREVDFTVNWQLYGPSHLWVKRHFLQAFLFIKNGHLQEALDLLQKLDHLPHNIGTIPACGDSFVYTAASVGEYEAEEDPRRFYHMGCVHEKMGKLKDARECWERGCAIPLYTGYESGYQPYVWSQRYFQAISLQKLGRHAEANAFFDAMELLAKSRELSVPVREALMRWVERGRFAPDDEKDPGYRTLYDLETVAEA